MNKALTAKGSELFVALCEACHLGFGENHLTAYPDLSMLSNPVHESFNDILLKGKLSYYGMANFSDILKQEDVDAIHQYLVSVQKKRFEDNQVNKKK
jgi:quinohemoprotein ethanol dehydrogenase